MLEILKESLRDEDLKGSSARFQSLVLTCVGAFIAIIALFLVANGHDVAVYATSVVGICFGTSSAKTWAGQIKSAKTKVERIKSQAPKKENSS